MKRSFTSVSRELARVGVELFISTYGSTLVAAESMYLFYPLARPLAQLLTTDLSFHQFNKALSVAGGPAFLGLVFPSRYETVGAPSLGSWQGRERAACTMGFAMPSGLHRTYGAHHLHFITCSCYRRLPFLRTARGRDRFLSILEQTRERYRFVVVGYASCRNTFICLSPNPKSELHPR